jgi:hypothetical protein
MNMLLFFLGSCVLMALRAERRDELPRTRSVFIVIVIVSTGYLSRRFI